MVPYEFSKDGNEIRINRLDLPYPWVNYLTNTRLSAMVSQAGGGFVWYLAPDKFRLTRYRHNQIPTDSPGFYVYIKEENGQIWSPTFRPIANGVDTRYAVHRAGETVFVARKNDITAELSLKILPDYDVLAWELQLSNFGNAPRHFDIFAYAELSQMNYIGEQLFGYYWQHRLQTNFDPKTQALFYLCHHTESDREQQTSPLVYFASDHDVKSYCGDRDAFIGNYNSESAPKAVTDGHCGNEVLASGNPCAALHIELDCAPADTQITHFFLGAEKGALVDYAHAKSEADRMIQAMRNPEILESQNRILTERYHAYFEKFSCQIPDPIAERQINLWGPLNALQFSLFHQTPQPSAPGVRGIGARDKTQALMAMAFRNPAEVKRSALFMLSMQYTNGSMPHNIDGQMDVYGQINPFSIKTAKSDDHLWMGFLIYALASESDCSVLTEKVPYRDLSGNTTKKSETVWRHLMRAVEFTVNHCGDHGLPLMLNGDWNDIISKFSYKGKGESVFAAQQLIALLDRMIQLADHCGYREDQRKLKQIQQAQKKALLSCAWTGSRWCRGFDDNGKPIGTEESPFGKLWLNPQTWAVLSDVGSPEQQQAGMAAVDRQLDTGYGLQLLTPGFQTYPFVSDPFSSYNPGTGENGAIFCHAHTWAIIANAKLGKVDRAWKYYCDLIPHNLVQRLGIEVYRSDPFGWVSNIVGPENSKHGWGNVIRLTGTAAWMNIAATQYLLGVRTTLDGIKFDPCIPQEWNGFHVDRLYRGCMLNIEIDNSRHVSHGVRSVFVDGIRYDTNKIPKAVFEGKKQSNITVCMGI